MSKSTGIHIGPQTAVGSWSLVTENASGMWQEVGHSLFSPLGSTLASFPSLSALDSGMSTSLAVAPTTILGYFMGRTWRQWEET